MSGEVVTPRIGWHLSLRITVGFTITLHRTRIVRCPCHGKIATKSQTACTYDWIFLGVLAFASHGILMTRTLHPETLGLSMRGLIRSTPRSERQCVDSASIRCRGSFVQALRTL